MPRERTATDDAFYKIRARGGNVGETLTNWRRIATLPKAEIIATALALAGHATGTHYGDATARTFQAQHQALKDEHVL